MMVRKGYRLGHTREQGFTLWEMALIVALLGVAMIIGVSAVRAPIHERQIVDQQRLLHWADKQIVAFAQINGRLPCADINGDGLENCGAGSNKGWLPYKTLDFQSTMPGRGVPHLKYVAYRGLSQDLSVTSATRYQPANWKLWSSSPGNWANSHYTGSGLENTNDLDLCSALEDDATQTATTPSATSANFTDGGVVHNVAYGLAVSGGGGLYAGSLFEGLNAQNSASMEAPGRSPDSSYNDQVFVRTFASMRKALSCESVVQSVNAVGMSVGVLDDIAAQKQSMITSTSIAMGLMVLGDALQVAELAESIGALAAAIEKEAEAAAELAAAIASCLVLVGCAFIPQAAAAVGFATAAIVAAGVAVAANAVAVPLLATATGYVVTAEIDLLGKSTFTPISNKATTDYWASQQTRKTQLQSEVATLQITVNNELTHLNNLRSQIISDAENYRFKTVTQKKKKVKVNQDPCTGSNTDCKPGPILNAALTAAVNDAQSNQNYANSSSSTDSSQCNQLPNTTTVNTTSLNTQLSSSSSYSLGSNVGQYLQYLDPSWIQGKFDAAFGAGSGSSTTKTPRQLCLDSLAHTTVLKSTWDKAKISFNDAVTAVNNTYKYPNTAYVCVSTATKPDSYNDLSYISGQCVFPYPGVTQTLLQAELNNYESSDYQYLTDQYALNKKKSELQSLQSMLDNQGGSGSTQTGTPLSIYTSGYMDILKNVDSRGAIK